MDFIEDFSRQQEWDSFVDNHPFARFCHLYAYRCVDQVYGYVPRYFALRDNDRIIAVLPAFETRSMLFGRRLISQPFSEYGGLLLDAQIPETALPGVINQLRDALTSLGLPGIEMHGAFGLPAAVSEQFLTKTNSQSLAYLTLDRSLDDIWRKVVTHQVRKAVQKAERSGVTVIDRCDGPTIVRDFYPLYLLSMKRLGVPPHSIQYYLKCLDAFGGRMKIFWAIHEGRPISGLLGFTCGKRVSLINIVSDDRFWEIRPNDLIHWEFIKWAHAAGYQYFDFGSIRYEGQLRYKQKWGCTIEPHGYYHFTVGGARPSGTFDSSSAGMARMSRIWSAWVPGPVARNLGPVLRKHLAR